MQSLTQAYDYIYWENQSGYYPAIKYPGIPCTSLDPLSSTQTGKSNFSVTSSECKLTTASFWGSLQKNTWIVRISIVTPTMIFAFCQQNRGKVRQKKKKKWRSGERSAFIIQFTIVLTGMLDFPGPKMHQLRLLESYSSVNSCRTKQ